MSASSADRVDELLGLVATAGVQLAVLACAAGIALAGATLLAMPRARAAAV